MTLTTVQAALVEAPAGRRVFLGGTGAGKSLVLADRAARLIASGARAEAVLLLAPSRRAAVAMRDRAQRGPGGGIAPMATSFHGLALTILRRHHADMGYPRLPRLLTTEGHFRELREALASEDPALWPHLSDALGGSALCRLAYDVTMGAAENGLDVEDIRRHALLIGKPELEDLANFAGRYWARQRQEGALDFGDLLARVIALLDSRPQLAARYRRAFRHILVDEYEQANHAQGELLRLLLDGDSDLLVAGDPAQAINSYRGGSPAQILNAGQRLHADVISSSENHRSLGTLGAVSRATLTAQPMAEERALAACAVEERDAPIDSGHVEIRTFVYLTEEARWISSEVARLIAGGRPERHIAILLRAVHSPIAGLIDNELTLRGIAHQGPLGDNVVGQPLVRSAMLMLRYLLLTREIGTDENCGGTSVRAASAIRAGDPSLDAREEASGKLLLALLDSPLAGLPPFGVAELTRAAALVGRDPSQLETEGVEGLALSGTLRAALTALIKRLAALRGKLDSRATTLLWEVWRDFPAFRDDALVGRKASAAFAALMKQVASLEEQRSFLGLAELIQLVDSGHFDNLSSTKPQNQGIVVTTVHAAKGREWDVVFLPDMVEGHFPSRPSPLDLGPALAAELPDDGPSDPAEATAWFGALRRERHREEERRVFHTGVSRARRVLYLSFSRRGADGTSAELPSRFLTAIRCCPDVAVVPAAAQGDLPNTVDGAILHYRRLLNVKDVLTQTQALYALEKLQRRWPAAVQPEQWWSNVGETSGGDAPFPDGKLHLSASRLGAFRGCPLAYQFRYHWQLGEPEGPALSIGSVLHKVLEEYHQPGSVLPRSREALEGLVEHHFEPTVFRYKPIARQARKRLHQMLDAYFERYGQATTVVALEQKFSFALGLHTIRGFIDRIDRLSDGLELIDYKTGSAMAYSDARNDLQLALYDLAFYHDRALAALGQPVLASYLYLKNIGVRADGKRSYAPTPESRRRLEALVHHYAKAIVAERFPAHREIAQTFPDLDADELAYILKKDPCRFCSFDWICPEQEREATGD